MKKANKEKMEVASEYDFGFGVRGKYAGRYEQGTNVIILEKDVAAMFPTSSDVNKTLRALVPIIRLHQSL